MMPVAETYKNNNTDAARSNGRKMQDVSWPLFCRDLFKKAMKVTGVFLVAKQVPSLSGLLLAGSHRD